jgi:coatomer subunit gamma
LFSVIEQLYCFNSTIFRCRRCVSDFFLVLTFLYFSHLQAESSDVFFSVTKLFQHKDMHLRRMVYLCIKEFIPSSDEVIIITSSLMKDMNSTNDLYRANAIRVLCKIIDSQMLLQIERYLKQAVVDKSAVVASAVLAGAIQLAPNNAEVIKRWNSEVQEAVTSKHPMVQFHAVALQHALRSSDRLAINKLVTQLTARGAVRSPMAQLLLVRYVAQVIADSPPPAGGGARPFFDFLESCLRHKSEIVIFEAARAICNMREVSTRELTPAVTVLQLFLSSSKPVLRFAAVRTLNRVAMSHPMAVTGCNIDMEALIADPNRSIATLAITTLLKTGNESSIDRLLKQISGFMGELADEFKIVVVEAIRGLCLKFPSKYRGMLSFLAGVLREDGGFEYKRAIVDAILAIIQEIPEAKETGLGQLSEFIEDCEFTFLSVQILHLLGAEGPKSKEPARYIRFIYNRVILENATVRAAALSALARFAAECPSLRPRIVILLRRALYDSDDEVRDRATLYLAQLGEVSEDTALAPGSGLIDPDWNIPAKALESKLNEYLAAGDTAEPFDLSCVPTVLPPSPKTKSKHQGLAAAITSAAVETTADEYTAQLRAVPEIAALGPVFKSCSPVQLTEDETEYKVVCVRHVLAEHDVFQFSITNTVKEQVLEEVGVAMDLGDAPDYEEVMSLPLAVAPQEGAGQAYVVLARNVGLSLGRFGCTLKFRVKEIDPSTGEAEEDGYEDEYQLEDVIANGSDYIKPAYVPSFGDAWDEADEESEVVDSYGLGQREGLQDAVEAIVRLMGMAACEGSDAVPPNARSHAAMLAGTLVGDVQVLVRLNFGIDAGRNVAMKMAVRSDSPETSEGVHLIISEA